MREYCHSIFSVWTILLASLLAPSPAGAMQQQSDGAISSAPHLQLHADPLHGPHQYRIQRYHALAAAAREEKQKMAEGGLLCDMEVLNADMPFPSAVPNHQNHDHDSASAASVDVSAHTPAGRGDRSCRDRGRPSEGGSYLLCSLHRQIICPAGCFLFPQLHPS